jgi:hypothetical protein
VIVEPDRERALNRLAAADFPDAQVILPSLPPGFGDVPACDGQITWQARAPERLELDVTTRQPCILVLSELFYPGWRATVDGAAATILPADLILRAIPLSPGRHAVSFIFQPASFTIGAALSATTVVLALAGILLARRRRT